MIMLDRGNTLNEIRDSIGLPPLENDHIPAMPLYSPEVLELAREIEWVKQQCSTGIADEETLRMMEFINRYGR